MSTAKPSAAAPSRPRRSRSGPAPLRATPHPPRGLRLPPDERRRALLRAAAELMTTAGVDGVQFAEVAARAGVTRPLVYKFFPSRQALIMAVLEDFAGELAQRLGRGAMHRIPVSNAELAAMLVESVCDTIESRGAGPWHVLDSKGPDPEIARFGEAIADRLMAPWRSWIVQKTGVSEREAATVARMVVAAGRAVLELWCAGALTREEAVRDAARGVSALVEGFARPVGGRAVKPATRRRRSGGA